MSSTNGAIPNYSATQVTAAFREAGISLTSFNPIGGVSILLDRDLSPSSQSSPWLTVEIYPSAANGAIATPAAMRVQKINFRGYVLTHLENVLIWVARSAPNAYAQRVRRAARVLGHS